MRNLRLLVLLIFLLSVIGQNADALAQIDIQANSALLMEPVSGEVLYAKDENKRVYPASITKIMTAMLAIEKGKLSDVLTGQRRFRDRPRPRRKLHKPGSGKRGSS